MKKFDLMIFDLDGTLVDSARDLIDAVNYTRQSLGLSSLEDQTIMGFVGDGTDKLVERFLGPEFQHYRERTMDIFTDYYDAHILDNTALYPGVSDMLEAFQGKRKIIITNKRISFTRKITDGLGISGSFDEIIGIGSTPFRKPDARIALPLLDRFDVDPSDVIIFGDGVTDIQLAKNTGMKSCALLNGFTPRETLLALQPDFSCEAISELTSLFC